jgi:hypothetical protein
MPWRLFQCVSWQHRTRTTVQISSEGNFGQTGVLHGVFSRKTGYLGPPVGRAFSNIHIRRQAKATVPAAAAHFSWGDSLAEDVEDLQLQLEALSGASAAGAAADATWAVGCTPASSGGIAAAAAGFDSDHWEGDQDPIYNLAAAAALHAATNGGHGLDTKGQAAVQPRPQAATHPRSQCVASLSAGPCDSPGPYRPPATRVY